MSPRDALKRMLSPAVQPSSDMGLAAGVDLGSAQKRLAQIMAEVSTTPVEDFFPQARSQPRRDPSSALKWFVATDVCAFLFGFVLAWVIAAIANLYLLERTFPLLDASDVLFQATVFGVTAFGVILWFAHTGHYRRRMPFWSEIQKTVNAIGFALMVNGFFQFALKQDFSRLWLTFGWVFAGVGLVVLRNLARLVMRRKGLWQVRTLLVGSGVMADDARVALGSERGLGYEVVMQIENLPLLLDRLNGSWESLCDRFSADYVVIALDGAALVEADDAIASLVTTGIPFSVSPPLRHMPVLGMSPQYFFSHDTILMSPVNNLDQPLPRFFKRTMDVLLSGAALLVLSPIFLLFAFVVKHDGGPAFFGDKRVGLGGRVFHCLKFRSMILNNDVVLEKYLAANPDRRRDWDTYRKIKDHDPRITKFGAFLRKWSLDELPQLINVFRGDMSLVGPRPIMFCERGMYNSGFALYSRVRPGLTGLWQVSGRSDVSFARRVQMDGWYVRNWSLWHDIAIMCKTVPVILKKTGAY